MSSYFTLYVMVFQKTLANFLDRKTQLYEQGADVRRIGVIRQEPVEVGDSPIALQTGFESLNLVRLFCPIIYKGKN
jgi:hypothetical protein